MSTRTIIHHSEELKRALKWIAEKRAQTPDASTAFLVSEAGPRFNLSPRDQETLMFLAKSNKDCANQPA